jgi:hypothetical protein
MVEKISWWNHPENRVIVQLPIAVVEGEKYFVASTNDETKKFLGDDLHGCAQGETKEEAINRMFELIKWSCEFQKECRLSYQRWVPFRKGDWTHIGGKWFIIFGIHFSFRWGKQNKYGWFVPFTPLNISVHSDWIVYKNYKKKS